MDIEKSKDSSPTELQGGKALANVVSYPGTTAGDQRLKEMGYEPEVSPDVSCYRSSPIEAERLVSFPCRSCVETSES